MPKASLLLLCMSLISHEVLAKETKWIKSNTLTQSDFHAITKNERKYVRSETAESMEASYLLVDDYEWYYHEGDLVIDGNFDNGNWLVVNGNLTIHGSYDDYSVGSGHLIVLGNVYVENFLNEGFAYIKNELKAKGLVYADYNDHNFEAIGGVASRGLIVSDKMVQIGTVESDFYINDDLSEKSFNENTGKAQKLLVPELYEAVDEDEDELSSSTPSYENVVARVRKNLPLFKNEIATNVLAEK